jgi:methylmalonyl-CoA mutase
MNSLSAENIFMRSLATRRQNLATSAVLKDVIGLLQLAGFDLIVVETAGIGQSDSEIADLADLSLYVMTSEYGAASQLEKIDMLD